MSEPLTTEALTVWVRDRLPGLTAHCDALDAHANKNTTEREEEPDDERSCDGVGV